MATKLTDKIGVQIEVPVERALMGNYHGDCELMI